ncbi:MAG TPA: hypothetical protein VND93_25655, partial [Myxococcales bacterium]|nr:hypothetical protein [Myxococcales bacterium]
MSVGSITNGLNSLLGRLSRTGPAEQGPGARPPVDPVGGLPARPSFQQRYQQDTFESGPGRQGRGGRGGGLDLSGRGHGGGAPGSDAQAQSDGQRPQQQPQARASQADAARDSGGGSPRARPADVTEFPKGQSPRQRVKQEPRDTDEQQRRRLQAERARQQ